MGTKVLLAFLTEEKGAEGVIHVRKTALGRPKRRPRVLSQPGLHSERDGVEG